MSHTPEPWYTKRATLPSLAGPPENPRRVLIECSDLALNHADNCVAVVAIMGFDTAQEAADEIAALRERVRVLENGLEKMADFTRTCCTLEEARESGNSGDVEAAADQDTQESYAKWARDLLAAARNLTPPATTKEPANG